MKSNISTHSAKELTLKFERKMTKGCLLRIKKNPLMIIFCSPLFTFKNVSNCPNMCVNSP